MWKLLVAILALAVVSPAHAELKKLTPGKQWMGRISNKLAESAPMDGYIAGPKALATLWKDWKLAGKVPTIDFSKDIVLIATAGGSEMGLTAMLDTDKGDLATSCISSLDLLPDSGYQIITVPRKGVKTINGKKPKFEPGKAEEP